MIEKQKPILLIGGYGSLGSKAVAILQDYYPDTPLVVAGRNPEKARELLNQFANVTALKIDLNKSDLNLPAEMSFSAVLLYTNDTTYNAQRYAQQQGIPFITVASSLAEMGFALACYVNNRQSASVVLSSQWMGGIADALAISYASNFEKIHSLTITTIVDDLDEIGQGSGADEIETILALNPYSIAVEKGIYKWLKTQDEKYYQVTTMDGTKYDGFAFPIADILSLNHAIIVDTIKFYTAEGKSYGTKKGGALTHDIVIEIDGILKGGSSALLHKEIIYPKGQAHMTALGSIMALEVAMGHLGSHLPNLYLGANLLEVTHVLKRLKEQGTLFLEK